MVCTVNAANNPTTEHTDFFMANSFTTHERKMQEVRPEQN
jgi:hypothetical protein